MTRILHRILLPLVAAAAVLLVLGDSRPGVAGSLDPFRPRGAAAGAPRLSPFRTLAQAAAPAVPAPAAPAAPAAIACTRDEQCPAGTICQDGTCRGFERPFNVLLFRKEGPFTAFIPFYFARRGTPGYRVVAPFYWHFWSTEGRSRVVAPLYWRFEDYLKQRVVTVVGPWARTVQPDARSWALWPIFYASTKFGWAAPLLGSFKVAWPEQGRSLGLYGFLYFWSRGREGRAFDLGIPLFVSSRSRASAFTFALPLNFYWRSGEDSNLLALPLFYRGARRDGSTFVSPLGYRSTSRSESRGALLWLYWYGRTPNTGYDVLFPAIWSFRSPTSTTTVVPPVLYFRRQGSSFATVFPLYWAARNETRGSSFKLLVPLFFWRSRDHGRGLTWLSPLGGYRRDDNEGSRALTFLLPPIFWRQDANRSLTSVLFLYWRYRDIPGDATTTLIGPAYWRDDPAGSTRVLFPLFWRFRDAATGARATALLPFFYRRSGPDETLTAAGPLFPLWGYHRRFADGGWSAGLFPVAFFGRRPDRGHGVIFPLLWHFRNERASRTVAFPIYYRFADRQGADAGLPPLLYFQGHDRDGRYQVQFPFFWRFVDDRRGAATTVVPPLFFRREPGHWSAGLAPLLFAGGGARRGHFVLFPLFWRFRDSDKDRTTTVALTYLHRRHGGEVTDALFPLIHYRRGARPGGAGETSFTLFPLVHYRRDARARVLATPLAASYRGPERQAGAVLPYFWYRSRAIAAQGVPPLWFDFTRLDTGERTRVFGPYVALDAPGRRSRALFPLFGRYVDGRETSTYLFPTYFRRRTSDGYALDTLFPLFWHSRSPQHATTVLGPFFVSSGPGRFSTGLPPLFVYSRNPERRLFLSPLFVRHASEKTGTRRTFSLLYYGSSHPEGETSVLFPLWWAARRNEVTHRVLFPVYWHFANTKEDRSWTLAGPLLWSRHGTWRTRGLMPVAWYSRDAATGAGSNALLPFFYERHRAQERMLLTLPFGFKSAPDRGWFYAGPFFRRQTWQTTFTTLFPLYFAHHDQVSETTTRVIPPLLHFSRSSPDRSLSGWLLLFWRHRTITSSNTLALPLFWDFHSFQESRLSLLLPLFFRYRNDLSGNTYSLAPLFYRRSGRADSTTIAFPLLWDFRGADRRTTVLFPFYASIRRPNFQARFVFPNVYHRVGLGPDAGTSRLFVFPFWESAVKRPGDYMWEVLLGLVGAERIGRNRFMKLFFIPFEVAPAPAAQTAWYGRPPPPAPRVRAAGVRTKVW